VPHAPAWWRCLKRNRQAPALIEYYENNSVQLFNLDNDIEEENDLAEEEPEKVKELRAMLGSWRESVGAKMMSPNPNYDTTAVPGNLK
jgi:hypothetical protein